MMQVIDSHLLLSPSMKGQSSTTSNTCPSDARSNASIDSCRSKQAQSNSSSKGNKTENTKAKNSLCRNFMQKGACPYGNKCQFAHGLHELRCNSERQMLYKTRQCNAFIKNGFCMYGTRCNFLHSEQSQDEDFVNPIKIKPGYREILSKWALGNSSKILSLLGKSEEEQISSGCF